MMAGWITVCVLALLGCGTDPAQGCPADDPTSCPTPVPSYANDIAPLIQTYCTSQCHNATGSASYPLATWDDLSGGATDVTNQIYQCRMPEPPAPNPTIEERVTLLAWFRCGAPNN